MSCVALGIGATLCAAPSFGAEWRISPSAYVGTSYADNPRLLTEGGESSGGGVAELSTAIRAITERADFSLRPRWRSARYDDDESLDSDDQFINAHYQWLTERSQWASDLALVRDSTLTSELGLTGLVQSNRRHEAITVSAGPTFMVSERASVGGQLYSVDNHYIDAESTGLVDYTYRALSLFTTYAASDRSSFTLTARGGRLRSESSSSSVTRDAALKLSWSYQLYDLWKVSLSAGPSYVDAAAGSNTGEVFELEAKRQGELWSLTTSATRSVTPTGRGVLTRRDLLSLSTNRQLAERLSATVGAQWIRSEDLTPQHGVTTYYTEYARVDLTGYWRVAQNWSLALQLTGSTQEYEQNPQRAENYRALLSMVWNGLPLSL